MAHLHLTLRPDPSELLPLRDRVRSYLSDLHEPAGDWLLIATEVATNAIEASPEDGTVEVSMRADEERIEFVVTDDGPGFGPAPLTSVGAESRRGRGLMIVSALAKRFAVSRVAGRTVTHVERPRVEHVDVVVIGLGSAGEAAARTLALAGRTVVGFEHQRVGGECPFVACMPSKALLHDAHLVSGDGSVARRWDQAVARRDDIVDHRDDTEHARALSEAGVELVRSRAELIGPNLVEAGGKAWYGDHVLLACGTAPIVPDIDGLERDRIWTAFDALASPDLPPTIAVLGAGPVGCELADVYRSFGSRVTMIDHADRLLPDHDAEVADGYLHALRNRGMDIRLSTAVERVKHDDDGDVVHTSGGDALTVDKIIVATGQGPRLAGLGLASAGLEPDCIPDLDDQRRAIGHPWLHVLGDLNGLHPWTHGANRDADIVAADILGHPWSATSSAMPHATFTDPPAAHVGTAASAERPMIRGIGHYSDTARSSTDELLDGLVVVMVDPVTGLVAGCSAFGPLADEIIATATTLVQFDIHIERARTQVFAFPTISQVLEVAIADAADQWADN